MSDATTSRVEMTLGSTLESVRMVEDTALSFALEAGFDSDTASNVAMVSREAAVNAVVHGNRYDPGKRMHAKFETTPETLRISISDEGEGLDVDALPDPLAPGNVLLASGRGIFLIRAFMDEVHFRPLGPGTEITLIKHRTHQ